MNRMVTCVVVLEANCCLPATVLSPECLECAGRAYTQGLPRQCHRDTLSA